MGISTTTPIYVSISNHFSLTFLLLVRYFVSIKVAVHVDVAQRRSQRQKALLYHHRPHLSREVENQQDLRLGGSL